MKINETKSLGPAKIVIQSIAILAAIVAGIFSHGAMVRVFSIVVLLTVTFCLQPNLCRDRSGSLVPMFLFLAVAWLGVICLFFSR